MNAIYSAEIPGDQELLCTAYATFVIHMKEKCLYPSFFRFEILFFFLQCYLNYIVYKNCVISPKLNIN